MKKNKFVLAIITIFGISLLAACVECAQCEMGFNDVEYCEADFPTSEAYEAAIESAEFLGYECVR